MICPDCGEQFPASEMTLVEGGEHICPDCLEDNYAQCEKCGQWSQRGYTSPASEFLCEACYRCEEEASGEKELFHDVKGFL